VSILKKRDDREGKTIAQVQQRQTKRRVRFQEIEDTLDQGNLKLLIHGLCSWGANDVDLFVYKSEVGVCCTYCLGFLKLHQVISEGH